MSRQATAWPSWRGCSCSSARTGLAGDPTKTIPGALMLGPPAADDRQGGTAHAGELGPVVPGSGRDRDLLCPQPGRRPGGREPAPGPRRPPTLEVTVRDQDDKLI